MESIVSTTDPWGFAHPLQNGHHPSLLVEELYPAEVQDCELTAELAGDFDALLPGFEATTWADLETARQPGPAAASGSAACPGWCVCTGDDTSTHLGVEHLVRPTCGGGSFGYEGGDVAVSLQLEHDPAPTGQTSDAPVVVLQLRVNGQEQYAYLTSTETFELRALLGGLLTDIEVGC